MYIRPKRCQQVAFSEPNIQVMDAVIVKAGNPHNIHSFADVGKNSKLKVGGVLGGASVKNAVAGGVAKSQIVEFPHWSESVAAVKAGRIHGAIQTAVTAQRTLADAKDPGIERALPFEPPVVNGKPLINYAGFAIRLESKDLLANFNKAYLAIKGTPEHEAILKKYGLSKNEIPQNITTAKICNP
jgi:polar amino acid transport system substrate-binding protein